MKNLFLCGMSLFFVLSAVAGQNKSKTTPSRSTASSSDYQQYGFWPSNAVHVNGDGTYTVNSFSFKTSDKKIDKFIDCAIKKYPKVNIYFFGFDDSSGKSIVTTSYLCKGEITGGNCSDTDEQWFCQ